MPLFQTRRLLAVAGLLLGCASPVAAERLRQPVRIEAHAGTPTERVGLLVDADEEYLVIETDRGPFHLRWDALDRPAFEAAKEAVLSPEQKRWRRGERERAWVAVAEWLKGRGEPAERVEWAMAHARGEAPPARRNAGEKGDAEGLDFAALDPLGRWGELTPELLAEGLAVQVAFIDAAMAKTGLELDAYPEASEHFLLYTDLSEREARKWTAKLDGMQASMGVAFGLEPEARIHFGRTLVVVLERREDFEDFLEKVHGERDVDGYGAFCFWQADGHARIVFHRQADDEDFERLLVHEAAHAVVHRLRSPVSPPSWLNEGIAEHVARRLVPTRSGVRVQAREARAALREPAGFLSPTQRIPLRDYGLAEGFVGWLIAGDGARFRELFDSIKAGLGQEEAFERAYGRTPSEVLAAYAATLR